MTIFNRIKQALTITPPKHESIHGHPPADTTSPPAKRPWRLDKKRAFFWRVADDEPWMLIVPKSVAYSPAVAQRGVKTAKQLGLEDIYDKDDLVERREEIHESAREDYPGNKEERDQLIKDELDELEHEIRWNDSMVVVPAKRADGSKPWIAAVINRQAYIGTHDWVAGEEVHIHCLFRNID